MRIGSKLTLQEQASRVFAGLDAISANGNELAVVDRLLVRIFLYHD